MVKNYDRGLENTARGRGHSFSPYGPTLSRQITYIHLNKKYGGLNLKYSGN